MKLKKSLSENKEENKFFNSLSIIDSNNSLLVFGCSVIVIYSELNLPVRISWYGDILIFYFQMIRSQCRYGNLFGGFCGICVYDFLFDELAIFDSDIGIGFAMNFLGFRIKDLVWVIIAESIVDCGVLWGKEMWHQRIKKK